MPGLTLRLPVIPLMNIGKVVKKQKAQVLKYLRYVIGFGTNAWRQINLCPNAPLPGKNGAVIKTILLPAHSTHKPQPGHLQDRVLPRAVIMASAVSTPLLFILLMPTRFM